MNVKFNISKYFNCILMITFDIKSLAIDNGNFGFKIACVLNSKLINNYRLECNWYPYFKRRFYKLIN
jgi:hypothetical protein